MYGVAGVPPGRVQERLRDQVVQRPLRVGFDEVAGRVAEEVGELRLELRTIGRDQRLDIGRRLEAVPDLGEVYPHLTDGEGGGGSPAQATRSRAAAGAPKMDRIAGFANILALMSGIGRGHATGCYLSLGLNRGRFPHRTRVTAMSLSRALQGVRVLDLSRLLPGPFLTMVLADLGADVVKVEEPRRGDYMRDFPPRGEGASGRYLAVNRNKRSVTMDLKNDRERERFLRMAARADVVVESFRPGVMDRLGVGYAVLGDRNERIILCSISGYGQTGPYRDRAGHDINYLALAGVLAMSGQDPDGAPALAGVQIADLGGGALWGALAILAALIDRDRAGRGAHLDISMTEGALALLASEFGIVHAEPSPPTRGTGLLNGGAARYGVYRTRDGRYLSVGALEPQFLARLAAAAGLEPGLGPTGDADLRRQLTRVIATRTRDEWAGIFAPHDCCCEPVLELAEVPEHSLHRERGLFFEIPDRGSAGTLQVRTPLGTPNARRPAPTLGEHNDEVFREYGVEDLSS